MAVILSQLVISLQLALLPASSPLPETLCSFSDGHHPVSGSFPIFAIEPDCHSQGHFAVDTFCETSLQGLLLVPGHQKELLMPLGLKASALSALIPDSWI